MMIAANSQKKTRERTEEFAGQFRRRTGTEVFTDGPTRILYSTDASIYQVIPHAVVYPRHEEDVQACIELGGVAGLAVLARGAGTSLAGQAVAQAVVLDFSRYMNRLVEFCREERRVIVQPGLVLDRLNSQIAFAGLAFGPDPASADRATLGGVVANNSTGSHSLKYGMTVDHLCGLRVVLDSGEAVWLKSGLSTKEIAAKNGRIGQIEGRIDRLIERAGPVIAAKMPRHWRRCGGYNLDRLVNGQSFPKRRSQGSSLADLICGSEGTLALMTAIELDLVERPQQKVLHVCLFTNTDQALEFVPHLLELEPDAIELLDRLSLELCRGVPHYAALLKECIGGQPQCLLLVEFSGAGLREKSERLERLAASQHFETKTWLCLDDPRDQSKIWAVRKAGLGLLMSERSPFKPIAFIEDAAVPVEHLARYVKEMERCCAELGTRLTYYAHAGAGCLHLRPLIDMSQIEEIAKLPVIARHSLSLVKRYAGVISSEHGDGRTRSWLNEDFFGAEIYPLFKEVKSIFDPNGRFNPGMIVDAQAMVDHLRYQGRKSAPVFRPYLDFSDDRGLVAALDICNGSAVCRKTATGVMCPSFMVSGDELYSTRGRANLMRAAIDGTLDPSHLAGPELKETMETCLSCKGCLSECPSMVDMAKLKFEYLCHAHHQHGLPLRDWLIGSYDLFSRYLSGYPAYLINPILRSVPARRLLDRFGRIDPKRSLPKFSPRPFNRWFAKRENHLRNGGGKKTLVLFADTHANYHFPEIAIAATELLEKLGYSIVLSGHRCCGRAAISKGMLRQAKKKAIDTVIALAPFCRKGIPIVGLEPSCILTLRDEYRHLLPKDELIRLLGENSYTLEEFLIAETKLGRIEPVVPGENRSEILYHPHCHQRAIAGTSGIVDLFHQFGYRIELIEAGCCGMAGSFGYEKEHADLARAIARERLIPAIENRSKATLVCTSGASCREQILSLTGRRVFHPAELFRNSLYITKE